MIYLYYGKVGDGKTYHVVNRELIPAILAGRKIYTNIEGLSLPNISTYLSLLYTDVVSKIIHVDPYNKDAVRNIYKIAEHGSLIIIDESHDYWDAREYKNTDKEFLDWLSKSRHQGYDVVFITQSPKRLEGNVVRLCNFAYQIKNIGFIGRLVKSFYVVHCRQSPNDAIVSTFRGRYNPAIFSLYSSFIVSVQKSSKIRINSGLLGGKALVFGACVAGLLIFMTSRGGLGILNADMQKKSIAKIQQKGGLSNAQVPIYNYSGPVNQKALPLVQVPGQPNTLPMSPQDVPCQPIGYVEANSHVDVFKRCGEEIRHYRDGKLYKKATLPASSATAEGGHSSLLASSGDLVSNTNNSNTIEKNNIE